MSRGMLLVLVGLFIAFGAIAEPMSLSERPGTTQLEFSKAEYYAAKEAYELGNATQLQLKMLSRTGFLGEGPSIDYAGGPDPFGYMFRDSDEPDGPTYSWVDITGTGTQWVGPPDDGNSGALTLPFTFHFYGVDYTEFFIHSNGAISFTDQYVSWGNNQIPTVSNSDLIAPLWADLSPNVGGEIWYGAATVNGQNALVVSFINVPDYFGVYSATFQGILLEDGSMWFQYNTATVGGWDEESIGVQGLNDGTSGLFISYYDNPAAYPYDGIAIEVYTDAVADATLEGYVTDSVTGDPVVGADVDVNGTLVTTDVTGFYTAGPFFPVTVDVSATAMGYFAFGPVPVDLVSGVNTFDFTMDPTPDQTYFTDFEGGPEPFTTDDPAWEYGTPGSLPTGAYSGDYAWATGLAGPYDNNADAWLVSGPFHIDDPNAFMSYFHFLDYETYWDGYNVRISIDEGATWDILTPIGGYPEPSVVGLDGEPGFSGAPDVWEMVEIPFGAYAGMDAWVAFRHGSDGSVTYSGVAIDDFAMYGTSPFTPPPVVIDLIPVVDVVPETGGQLIYDVHLWSNIGLSRPGLRYQTFATLPNGNVFGPIDNIPWNLNPYMDVYVAGRTVDIPPMAPQGAYYFEGRAGVPNNPNMQIIDGFPFVKQGAGWSEDFEDGEAQNMDIFVGDLGTWMVDQGVLQIDVFAETDEWGSAVFTGDVFTNFSFSAQHELVQTIGNSVGVLFCADGPQDGDMNGYAVYTSNGYYSVWRYDSGLPSSLILWTLDPNINQGAGAVNVIQIDGSGGTYDLIVNGGYITSFTDMTHTSGFVGVACAYENETWFDNLNCFHGATPRVAIDPPEQGEVETVLRDDRGIVITDPADYYIPGNAGFDRSAEFTAEPFDFDVNDWVGGGPGFIAGKETGTVELPSEYMVTAAYPNPFNPTTTVRVALPSAADLNVSVYNINGQLVSTLSNGMFEAGLHSFVFDAANLSSGIYFVQAIVPGELNQVQKVTLMK